MCVDSLRGPCLSLAALSQACLPSSPYSGVIPPWGEDLQPDSITWTGDQGGGGWEGRLARSTVGTNRDAETSDGDRTLENPVLYLSFCHPGVRIQSSSPVKPASFSRTGPIFTFPKSVEPPLKWTNTEQPGSGRQAWRPVRFPRSSSTGVMESQGMDLSFPFLTQSGKGRPYLRLRNDPEIAFLSLFFSISCLQFKSIRQKMGSQNLQLNMPEFLIYLFIYLPFFSPFFLSPVPCSWNLSGSTLHRLG